MGKAETRYTRTSAPTSVGYEGLSSMGLPLAEETAKTVATTASHSDEQAETTHGL